MLVRVQKLSHTNSFLIQIATFQVGTFQYCICYSIYIIAMRFVMMSKVLYSPTVGGHIAIKFPLVTKNIL